MSNTKVLVTGGEGQLGTDVIKVLQDQGYEVYGFGKKELDITIKDQVEEIFSQIVPDIVVHTAAYTKVDLAETEYELAFNINALGTRNLATAADKYQAKLIYISTDYVFNGEKLEPYQEFDATNPINVYGESKLAGEEFVRSICPKYFIVRTSWVYGLHGNNFVKTMLQLAQKQTSLSVVHDQIGSPTYTIDLARCISDIMETDKYGTYHVSNSGYCSWYEFAKEIFNSASITIDLIPVTSEQFPRPAKRPRYSVMQHSALELNGFQMIRSWKDGLKDFLIEYKDTQILINN
ncbi:dTDP-4-dehydrorhamnose reductase [Paenibacillus sp. Soil787]|uniref:dTDP-4-dehydrorhamnose reductase n=1 Tax=Paenibacillus sp. Soil787 TaxID=1736411 RepID=UPI0006FB0E37|nr:dTDP-4-dehydrorhamnose reductase [Paenibacillus sp. Soil787]KRF35869.1 NAD(P)-dependent oxidoreductase [Paenibacillus sp. Soil787]